MSTVRAWDNNEDDGSYSTVEKIYTGHIDQEAGTTMTTTDYRLDGSIYTHPDPTPARPAADRDIDATLNRPATTTPSYADSRPTGNVPGLRPNPGMLRALLQPVLFLKLLEPVGAFEIGDVVAAQFWGEGRVMLTPLPAAASRGRIPTTYPANQIHAEIAGPVPEHYTK